MYLKHSNAELACQNNLQTASVAGHPIKGTMISIHDADQNKMIWDWATSLDDTNGGAPYWIGIRRDCLDAGCGFEWADFSTVSKEMRKNIQKIKIKKFIIKFSS